MSIVTRIPTLRLNLETKFLDLNPQRLCWMNQQPNRWEEDVVYYDVDDSDSSSLLIDSNLVSQSAASSASSVNVLSDIFDEVAELLFRDYGLKALCKDRFE